ncbi:MAG: hypothetical protein ACKV2V_30065 [Blastocatellia bacterium]
MAQKKKKQAPAKRPGTETPSATRPRTATGTAAATPETRAEINALSQQIVIFSRFLYLYGKIANGLELAEAQVKRGELAGALLEQNKQDKARVVASISSLKAGLNQTLTTFQGSSRWQSQAIMISSAVDYIGTAEQLAAQGQFDEAGKTLAQVPEKLAEVLAEIAKNPR